MTESRPEPALAHARRCLALCEEHAIDGFDLGAAYERLARANLLAGDDEGAARFEERARALAPTIDEEDREVLMADLASLEPH